MTKTPTTDPRNLAPAATPRRTTRRVTAPMFTAQSLPLFHAFRA